MNYARHYGLLIERARDRILEGYSERHHILPICVGGTNVKSNIVRLTPEEHFLAHQLLLKMHPDVRALAKAAKAMTMGEKRSSNKLFGWLRRKANAAQTGVKRSEQTRLAMREGWKNRTAEERAITKAKHATRVVSDETREKYRQAHLGKKQSDETKRKRSAALKGKPKSEETKAKLREIWKQKSQSAQS